MGTFSWTQLFTQGSCQSAAGPDGGGLVAPTFGRLGARAYTFLHVADLLALHADVLQPLVIRIDAVLEQLAQGH